MTASFIGGKIEKTADIFLITAKFTIQGCVEHTTLLAGTKLIYLRSERPLNLEMVDRASGNSMFFF